MMWDNVVGRHIRRCNRNLLLINAPILAVLAFFGFDNSRDLLNCFKGGLDAYAGLVVYISIVLLTAWNVRKAVARIQNVQNSLIYKWLGHYGQRPELIAQAIDQEFKNSRECWPISSITLLPSWLLHKSFFAFTTMNLNEIVWVYQRVTRHSINFIPTGTTFAIVIADAHGRTVVVDAGRGSKQLISGFMASLRMRIPWAVFGYSNEVKRLYKKSRSAFAEAVHANHIEHLQRMAKA